MTAALTPTKFTDADYVQLSHVFAGGDITKATKPELERYAVMLSRPSAHVHFTASSFEQIGATVHMLIQVRMSEESNKEATRISTIALWISIAALIAGVVQVVAAFR